MTEKLSDKLREGACPACGSEPGCNIDCGLCLLLGEINELEIQRDLLMAKNEEYKNMLGEY